LLGFLRGVLEEVVGTTWFFAGKNVVNCMVNVVRKRTLIEG
jgi:hypothetical protein